MPVVANHWFWPGPSPCQPEISLPFNSGVQPSSSRNGGSPCISPSFNTGLCCPAAVPIIAIASAHRRIFRTCHLLLSLILRESIKPIVAPHLTTYPWTLAFLAKFLGALASWWYSAPRHKDNKNPMVDLDRSGSYF